MRIFLFSLLFVAVKSYAQSDLQGVWRGTSLCQIKSSPCHDEQVVYHVSKKAGIDSFEVVANKMVDGKEEYMGTLIFFLDAKGQFVSADDARGGRWEFQRVGNKLSGRLIYKGQLYRLIEVKKDE